MNADEVVQKLVDKTKAGELVWAQGNLGSQMTVDVGDVSFTLDRRVPTRVIVQPDEGGSAHILRSKHIEDLVVLVEPYREASEQSILEKAARALEA